MARLARVKHDGGAFYHLCGRTAGPIGDLPFDDAQVRRRIIGFIRTFAKVYCCDVMGFSIMGNHYHLVVNMHDPLAMPHDALRKRAEVIYSPKELDHWSKEQWNRFEERVFDVSELMRQLQSSIARWYNRTHNRRGRFWADRFKSVLLQDEQAAFDCLLYVELNAVRAGIVECPEEYDGASLHYREIKDDRWMAPLVQLTGQERRAQGLRDYKARIYYRGSVPTKENQAVISKRMLAQEEARGFAVSGAFGKRLRHYTDGVVLGSQEFVRDRLDQLRASGIYKRRCNPILSTDGPYAILRPQRSDG